MKKVLCVWLIFVLLIYIIPLSTLITKRENKSLSGEKISVYNCEKDEVFYIPIEEYVFNAVSKEMPASFEGEALKAQAVAIRTYTLKKAKIKNDKHPDAVVCTDSNHCMAYNTQELEEKYRNKIIKVVEETKGEALMYEDEYASTVFHAISSGKTESSKDVWGGDVEYLVSVESEEDKNVSGYKTSVFVPYEDFLSKINGKDYEKVIGDSERTEAGSVSRIMLCGKEFTETKIREFFGLRSANFEIAEKEEGFEFIVYGYGHGVGMSQYGANNMAKKGSTYKEILSHYYPGTKVKKVV